MADIPAFQPHRFQAAAAHYLAGRQVYAPRIIELVARLADLGPDDRMMDLGCGPGILAGAFAPLVREVVAVDPEDAMLRIAEAEFGGSGRIRFVRGSSFDLGPALGEFHLVTMGRSFHWMDRADTLRRLDGMLDADGVIALFDTKHLDLPENAWYAPYRALLQGYAATDTDHARRRSERWVRHEAYLLDSVFCRLDQISVIERRAVTIEQLVHRAFSRSSTAPDRLGEAAARLAGEIEALLGPLARSGPLVETVRTDALLASRPERST